MWTTSTRYSSSPRTAHTTAPHRQPTIERGRRLSKCKTHMHALLADCHSKYLQPTNQPPASQLPSLNTEKSVSNGSASYTCELRWDKPQPTTLADAHGTELTERQPSTQSTEPVHSFLSLLEYLHGAGRILDSWDIHVNEQAVQGRSMHGRICII